MRAAQRVDFPRRRGRHEGAAKTRCANCSLFVRGCLSTQGACLSSTSCERTLSAWKRFRTSDRPDSSPELAVRELTRFALPLLCEMGSAQARGGAQVSRQNQEIEHAHQTRESRGRVLSLLP